MRRPLQRCAAIACLVAAPNRFVFAALFLLHRQWTGTRDRYSTVIRDRYSTVIRPLQHCNPRPLQHSNPLNAFKDSNLICSDVIILRIRIIVRL